MIINHRPSILHRPKRVEVSKGSTENLEKEHEKDRELLRIKAEHLAESEERLRRSSYRCAKDTKHNREEAEKAAAAAHAAKEEEQKRQAAAEALWSSKAAVPEVLYDVDRPWTAPTQLLNEEQMVNARRRHQMLAAQENMQAVAQGAQAQKQLSESEHRQVREATLKEEGFWNRGASSEKWIAPEHRVRARSEMAWKEAAKGAPYRVPGLPSSQQQPTPQGGTPQKEVPTSTAQPHSSRQYPWSWDADPKA